ncbi:hypothetical protein BVC80_8661g8 [Macleaya cordata]|uniref:Uncharacterized protein n=1 Tax=Macleaya cordata TaxID=56857 RepID=A0A200Q538_MACCD|nr:hypothetical protein BVC80_8661g8 [Macleaya cordata]
MSAAKQGTSLIFNWREGLASLLPHKQEPSLICGAWLERVITNIHRYLQWVRTIQGESPPYTKQGLRSSFQLRRDDVIQSNGADSRPWKDKHLGTEAVADSIRAPEIQIAQEMDSANNSQAMVIRLSNQLNNQERIIASDDDEQCKITAVLKEEETVDPFITYSEGMLRVKVGNLARIEEDGREVLLKMVELLIELSCKIGLLSRRRGNLIEAGIQEMKGLLTEVADRHRRKFLKNETGSLVEDLSEDEEERGDEDSVNGS